jgi:predicted RND superfamily exporter protein
MYAMFIAYSKAHLFFVAGIGADDAFIFCKVWQCAKAEKNGGSLVKLVHDTLRHAMLSMFVTSLTTAAAFYASYISSITAIGCFRLI